jgi:hypothetical protein
MLAVLGAVALCALTEHDPLTLANLRILGRTGADAVNFYWTGSGIELDLYGSELWVQLDVDWSWGEPWLSVLEKDQLLLRLPLQQGKQWYLLFRGLDASASHRITVLRETQPWSDPATSVRLVSLRFDGSLHKLADPRLRVEFLGDSYTSGEGALGTPQDTEWLPIWFSAACNYARLAAQELKGECRILSQAGWGLLGSYNNRPAEGLAQYYDQICGVVPSGKGSNKAKNDFAAWRPDVVVVALGTNDQAGWSAPAYTDPATGQAFRNTPALFEEGAYSFLVRLRALNPQAQLAWMFFEGETQVIQILERVVAKFKQNYDSRVSYFLIPHWAPTGARQHPGVDAHRQGAKTVAAKIAKIMGIAYP